MPEHGGLPDVTIGEVMRALTQFREDTHKDLEALNRRFDALDLVPSGVYAADKITAEAQREALIARIGRLEDGLQWMSRLLVGAVITAVISGLVAYAFYTGGG